MKRAAEDRPLFSGNGRCLAAEKAGVADKISPGSKGSPSESVLGDGLKLCALETPWIRLKSNR